jgi:hypothetical protein
MDVPPLVTTNPDTFPTLEDPDTVVLFGGDDVNNGANSGGRFSLGVWLDPCQMRGVEVSYLFLGNETTSYSASDDNFTILGRPFFNIETREADSNLIVFPDPSFTGSVRVTAETDFQGAEVLYRVAGERSCRWQADRLFGWRWFRLNDDLLISQSVTQSGSATIDLSDRFKSKNDFHGAEFGLQWQESITPLWTVEALGKLAIGNTRSVVVIAGQQTGDVDQGLLALDSNSGTHTRNSFAAVTEIGLSVKRQFTCGLEATFGYTLIYWSDLLRAGDQIDLDVDPRQIPPDPESATHPAFPAKATDFWAQGLHIGLEYAF